MDDGRGRERLSFLGKPLPGSFEIRVVVVAPGRERGEIELECLGGTGWRFGRGDVLWLIGLPVRTLHNPGREPAVLAAVSRRRRGRAETTRDR
jgi:hypothetical protein